MVTTEEVECLPPLVCDYKGERTLPGSIVENRAFLADLGDSGDGARSRGSFL